MKLLMVLFMSTMMLTTSTTFAADDLEITIAANSSSGTYKKMLGEIISRCSSEGFTIKEDATVKGGAPGNLDALVNNKVQAAFLHSDVFFANAQADSSYKRFQTLLALYPEPIHILALRKSKSKKQGSFSFGTVEFNSLSDMRGQVIGAAGGGSYTARILKGQGDGGFGVNSYESGKDAIAALNEGTVSAVVFVGAAPLPNLAEMNDSEKAKYKILPIGEAIANKLAGIYKPVSINYGSMTGNGPVKTLAPLATLITRKFNTGKKVDAQRHLRECFYKNLDSLKDEGSPNWQNVEVNDKGVLDWYEIPASATAKKK